MVSNWVTYVWAYVTGYTRWADAWTLFISGVMAAGITLPANGQPDRTWAFAILVILFNVAVNAIRRAKVTVTTSTPIAKSGETNLPDNIFILITALEDAITAYKATVTTTPVTTVPVVISPNANVTYPLTTPQYENAAEAAADIAAVNAANAAAALAATVAAPVALTPAEAAVVAANTVTKV